MKLRTLTLAAGTALVALTACTPAQVQDVVSQVTFPDPGTNTPVPLTSGVTRTDDPGDPATGRYPATLWHYDESVMEDVAGEDCAARGGSMIDDAAERFVCVTD